MLEVAVPPFGDYELMGIIVIGESHFPLALKRINELESLLVVTVRVYYQGWKVVGCHIIRDDEVVGVCDFKLKDKLFFFIIRIGGVGFIISNIESFGVVVHIFRVRLLMR